jgi:hypothetical protein
MDSINVLAIYGVILITGYTVIVLVFARVHPRIIGLVQCVVRNLLKKIF